MKIKLLHIYPELLNLYGEYANLSILSKYLTEEGADVEIISVSPGEHIPEGADLVYIGSGTESASFRALDALKSESEALRSYYEGGTPILATGNSFELFGKTVNDDKLGKMEGLSFFDFSVERTHKKRFLGDAVLSCALIPEKIIGFVNKCSTVNGVSSPLFSVEMGLGNNNSDPAEGMTENHFYGTSLIGPLLVRNPSFCRYIMDLIYRIKGSAPDSKADMELQNKAYDTALNKLLERMKEAK